MWLLRKWCRRTTAGLEIDAEGWLVGDTVRLYPSVRSSALVAPEPLAIVWHYTATDIGTAKSLARRIRKYRRGKDRAASWHVIVADDGTLYQSVPFVRGSWHCRRGRIAGHRTNACSVGVELEGYGMAFSEAQTRAAGALLGVLVEEYRISRHNAGIGHSDLDPKRRSDPGSLWSDEILPGLLDLAQARR
jgi:N-acetyl-anhydromuramyl-L-alanine amidase AmpD